MSTFLKEIKKILDNQIGVDFSTLNKILIFFGYVCKQSKKGTSHYVYRKDGCNPITIPKKKPIKKPYVDDVIKILKLEEYYEQQTEK